MKLWINSTIEEKEAVAYIVDNAEGYDEKLLEGGYATKEKQLNYYEVERTYIHDNKTLVVIWSGSSHWKDLINERIIKWKFI